MKYYKTAEVVQLPFNHVVGLSEPQAARRGKRLEPAVDGKDKVIEGQYRLLDRCDFKAGEIIGLGELPKLMRRQFVGGEEGEEPTTFNPKTGNPNKSAAKKKSPAKKKTAAKKKPTKKAE